MVKDMEKVESLDKLQRADHDTLIRLETKVDTMIAQLISFQDGVNKKIVEIDVRLGKVEDVHTKVEPEKALRRLECLEDWKKEVKIGIKTSIGIASGIGAVIGFAASIIGRFI